MAAETQSITELAYDRVRELLQLPPQQIVVAVQTLVYGLQSMEETALLQAFGTTEVESSDIDALLKLLSQDPERPKFCQFPAGEISLGLNLAFANSGAQFEAEVDRILDEVGYNRQTSQEDLEAALDESIQNLVGTLNPRVAWSLREELRAQLEIAVLRKSGIHRNVLIQYCDPRDRFQSVCARAPGIDEHCQMVRRILKSGVPCYRIEIHGGAFFQFGMMESLVGNKPQSGYEMCRRVMYVHRDCIIDVINEVDPSLLETEQVKAILARFALPTGDDRIRILLDESGLESILKTEGLEAISPETDAGREIIRLYRIRTTILFRGESGNSMHARNPEYITRHMVFMHQNGVDVFRCFDAVDDPRSLMLGVQGGVESGGFVQVTPHLDDNFHRGAEGFIEISRDGLLNYRSKVDAFTGKDAAGALEPTSAYKFFYAMSQFLHDNELGVPVDLHEHSNSGRAIRIILAAIRACHEEIPIIIDVNVSDGEGIEASGNPSLIILLHALLGTGCMPGTKPWGENGFESEVLGMEKEFSALVEAAMGGKEPLLTIDSTLRELVLASRNPGGAWATMLKEALAQTGFMRKKYNINVELKVAGKGTGRLSEAGKPYYRAYVVLILKTMPWLYTMLGNPSMVTPSSQAMIGQAIMAVRDQLKKDIYTPSVNTSGELEFDRNEAVPMEEPVIGPNIAAYWLDFLLNLSQRPDFYKYYPTVSAFMLRKALSSELRKVAALLEADCDSGEDGASIVQSIVELVPENGELTAQEEIVSRLGVLSVLAGLLGRPSVDSNVIKAAKAGLDHEIYKDDPIKFAKAIRRGTAEDGTPLKEFLADAADLDLFRSWKQLEEQYCEDEMPYEIFLLIAGFRDLSGNFALPKAYAHWREQIEAATEGTDEYRAAAQALNDMGDTKWLEGLVA